MTCATLDDDHLARAALTYLAEPADVRVGALIQAHGPVRTLDAIKTGRFPAAACAGKDRAETAAGPTAHTADQHTMRLWRARLPDVPSRQ